MYLYREHGNIDFSCTEPKTTLAKQPVTGGQYKAKANITRPHYGNRKTTLLVIHCDKMKIPGMAAGLWV